jgi:glycosyltransferase involved in cell wall biosynthesis
MKSVKTPLVSIILTVFNRENYLRRAINSLLSQKFRDWELIAINDGSSDDSYKILMEYGNLLSNIKAFTQENRKLAFSRNRGINLSFGKYITFLDSDDEYGENHLYERVKFMEGHHEIDLIHGGVKIIGDEFVRDKDNPFCFIHLSECTIGGTFFGKKNVFTSLDGFKENIYSEDSEFLRRARENFNIRKVNFNTYIYRRETDDSLTHNYAPQKIHLL